MSNTIQFGEEVVELVDLTADNDCVASDHSSTVSESSDDSDIEENPHLLQENDVSIVQQLTKCIPKTGLKAKAASPRRSQDKRPVFSTKYKVPMSPPASSYNRDCKNRLWPSLTHFYRDILSLCCTLDAKQGHLGKRSREKASRGAPRPRAPDLSLDWRPHHGPNIRPLPTTFDSVKQYMETFEPLVLEECRLCILHAYSTRYTSSSSRQNAEFQPVSIKECTYVPDAISNNSAHHTKLYLLRLATGASQVVADDGNICPGDVLMLHSSDKQLILGFVMGGDADYDYLTSSRNAATQQRDIVDVLICTDFDPLTLEDNLGMISIGSIVTSAREYQAIRSIPHLRPNAQRLLLNPAHVIISASPDRAPVPSPLWRHLSTEYNSSQLDALRAICSPADHIEGNAIPSNIAPINLRLLHGPPGTGKSQTILGMMALLFAGGVSLHQPGAKTGKKISIGASLSSSEPSKTVVRKPKVLLCAPSNTAVDELAVRLLRHGVIGEDGQARPLNVVRLGQGFDKSAGMSEEEQDASDHSKLKTMQELSMINFDYLVEQRKYSEFINVICYECGRKALSKKGSLNGLHRLSSMAEIRQDVLESTDILCCTLSGAGSHLLLDSIMHAPPSQRDGLMGSTTKRKFSGFDVVIIDEACQAVEPSTLIPLKFEPQVIVMVGDPMQLPPTVLSQRTKQAGYSRSLFQRLEDGGFNKLMLNIQYRMHPEISHFASKRFYHHKLLDDQSMMKHNSHAKPFHAESRFRPFLLYNIRSEELSDGFSYYNIIEAETILSLYERLRRVYADCLPGGIGIIAAYKGQEKYLRSIFRKAYGRSMGGGGGRQNFAGSTEISTVDGFQGREKDVIILSFVRTRQGGQVGFLNDRNRINVALTRAKYGLWIVGDIAVMEQCGGDWAALASTMQHHRLVLDRV